MHWFLFLRSLKCRSRAQYAVQVVYAEANHLLDMDNLVTSENLLDFMMIEGITLFGSQCRSGS